MGITVGLVLGGMMYLGNLLCLPVENNSCTSLLSVTENITQVSPQITTVLIPTGSEDPQSELNYEPQTVTVVLGVNNTVLWINQSPTTANTLTTDNFREGQQVPNAFQSSILMPEQSWEHTFTQAGTYGYHGDPHPWQKGTVIVLSHQ